MKYANVPSVKDVRDDIAKRKDAEWRAALQAQRDAKSFDHADYQDEMKYEYLYGNPNSDPRPAPQIIFTILIIFGIPMIAGLLLSLFG